MLVVLFLSVITSSVFWAVYSQITIDLAIT